MANGCKVEMYFLELYYDFYGKLYVIYNGFVPLLPFNTRFYERKNTLSYHLLLLIYFLKQSAMFSIVSLYSTREKSCINFTKNNKKIKD